MTIKEYFKDKQILTYTDVMDYANDTLLYSLREISADQVWDIEAVYHHKTDGPAYDITFRKEFFKSIQKTIIKYKHRR